MSNSYTNCGWLWKNRLYGSWMVLKRDDWLRQVLKMSSIITLSYSAKSTLISWIVLSWITSVATERPSAIAWSNVISREAIPWSPASANPHKFYPGVVINSGQLRLSLYEFLCRVNMWNETWPILSRQNCSFTTVVAIEFAAWAVSL